MTTNRKIITKQRLANVAAVVGLIALSITLDVAGTREAFFEGYESHIEPADNGEPTPADTTTVIQVP